jgi:galactose mutarotase-like enzyme
MYIKKETKEKGLSFVEVRNHDNTSWLKVAPERGGIITNLGLNSKELFFMNESTLFDKEKNIRGGNPILFPICGQLTNGQYEWNEKVYKMKNHGFARNLPWEVVNINTDSKEASITIKLESNPDTLISYPFEFTLIFTYVLRDNQLMIKQEYQNQSKQVMPMYPGFHPYFNSSNKRLRVETDASEYQDDNDKTIKKFDKVISINQKESYTLSTKISNFRFHLDELNEEVTIAYGNDFPYIVLWSEEGQNFVCVEPWMAKTDEFNKKDELVMIQPEASLLTSITISV